MMQTNSEKEAILASLRKQVKEAKEHLQAGIQKCIDPAQKAAYQEAYQVWKSAEEELNQDQINMKKVTDFICQGVSALALGILPIHGSC